MIKKINVFFALSLFLIFPIQAFASGYTAQYYPPSNSDYYQKKISWKLYFDPQTYKVRITQYQYGANQTDPASVVTTKLWNVTPNSYMWIDMKCKGATQIDFLDQSGNIIDMQQRGETDSYLNQGTCDSNSVAPSDYNEQEQRYASDTFGGTLNQLTNPPTPDGSGGTGTTGYQGDATSSSGTSSGGTSGGSTSTDCQACQVFSCPGWVQYMGEISDIKNAIPPPPNWGDVAGTFRDTIVPAVISDLRDMLGSAPDLPSPPQQPSGVDDRGITAPTGQQAPGLDNSGFSDGDIKDQAPKIPERSDPTGGFKINNPIDSLPSQDDFIKNSPIEGYNSTPANPTEGDNVAPTPSEGDNAAPTPSEGVNTAPTPSEGGNTAPTPSEGNNTAPTPTEGDNVAPTPSGGDNTAPLPNESGTAPLPGQDNSTAPIPGPDNSTAPLPGN